MTRILKLKIKSNIMKVFIIIQSLKKCIGSSQILYARFRIIKVCVYSLYLGVLCITQCLRY